MNCYPVGLLGELVDLIDLPQVSSPMPWHGREWAHFQEQLAAGKLPHALLLVGGQFTGKSQFALALSRMLLCAQAIGSLNCGRCHACELSASGSHGDFRWVQPADNSRIIKIEQIRDVVRFTNKTTGFGLRKVIVIAPAESMNVNAFNALLKSLEEPAKDTYFILVCHRMYCVPATIRSRCQILRFGNPHGEACLEWLDKTTGNREQSQHMLSLADGLPLLAHQLYCNGRGEEFTAGRLGLQVLLRGEITVLQAAAPWNEMDAGLFLDQLTTELQRLLGSLSLELLRANRGRSVFRLLDRIIQLQQAVSAGANPSKQLMIETLLSKLHRELGTSPLGDNI
jgi:DNA polymerase III subunit delta'